jgi:hypothetical protein
MPAVWPWLALNPEPMQSSGDPESVERYYNELFGVDAEPTPQHPQPIPQQEARRPDYRPSIHVRQFPVKP